MSKEDENQGFRVSDKRLFREDGEKRVPDSPPEPPEPPEPPAASSAGSPGPEPPPGTEARIDFPSYVLSYYTQGLVLLGEVPNPYTNKQEADLESARHTVDILALLQEKTRGNLTKEEEQLLDNILYELRVRFMAKTNRIKT